ncbi:MAG: hypothetical protein JWM14_3208 [Chitinophagaceae bacterium]|nr:hypothetical protein [Chitinophagaceae bacterium]
MAKITFESWKPGMKKISFIKLLHEKAELSLKESKSIKDRLVEGEVIEIIISDQCVAREIFFEAQNFNVVVKSEL